MCRVYIGVHVMCILQYKTCIVWYGQVFLQLNPGPLLRWSSLME